MKLDQKKIELQAIERDNLSSIKQQLLNMASRNKWADTNSHANGTLSGGHQADQYAHAQQHQHYQQSPTVYPPTQESSSNLRTPKDRDHRDHQKRVPNIKIQSPTKITMIDNKENKWVESTKYEDEGQMARLIKERSSLLGMG